jgi:aromatic ring-opening dioxygenase catalytic subunit (LigB family)
MTSESMPARLPTFFLSHGGGPWPYMKGEIRNRHANLESSLKALRQQLPTPPVAVLMVSGHWEEEDFAVMASASPPMVYDYHGFPEELYRIRYAAPGSPKLARRVHSLIREAGLASHLDYERGFDHGVYSMLAVTHPEAQTPVIQVSMRKGYAPEAHLRLGRALAPLRDEGILIMGSGASYHNFHPKNAKEESAAFDAWLASALTGCGPKERLERLVQWEHAPAARLAQPSEDHLVPLFVAVGAAREEPGQVIYREEGFLGSYTLSSYRFG